MKEEGRKGEDPKLRADGPSSSPSSFILHSSSFLPSSVEHDVSRSRASICVGYPWWLKPFLQHDVIAITLGRRIYVRKVLDGTNFERLLRHELAHVRQVDRLGLIVFLWRYVGEYARNWIRLRSAAAAYAAISFEIEARAAEEADSRTGL
jgi:hypothetical protein